MRKQYLGFGILSLALIACTTEDADFDPLADAGMTDTTTAEMMPGTQTDTPPTALAVLRDSEGTQVGTATFVQDGDAVRIEYEMRSLPSGERGFHLHEVGSCGPPTFDSAGDHYNPTGAAHGFDHPEGPHAGDLPNLEIGGDGAVSGSYTNDRISLATGRENSILDGDGTALVVHSDPDDYESQPSGDAGDRIACGVVEMGT